MTLMTPGMALGFGGVDADDVGVMDLGEHDRQMGDALGHLQCHVIAVVGQAGDLGEGGRAGMPGAVDLGLAVEVVRDVFHGGLAAHDLGGGHDRVDQRLVAGAAADVVVFFEPVAHVFTGGRGILRQQPVGGDDEAGRAETALGAAVGDPGLLQGMQVLWRADALDGGDLAELGHPLHLLGARADHFAVQDHRAGPADPRAAPDLHSGEAHAAEDLGQRVLLGVAHDESLDAVDLEAKSRESHSLFSLWWGEGRLYLCGSLLFFNKVYRTARGVVTEEADPHRRAARQA